MGIKDVNVISISKGVRRKATFDTIHFPNGKESSINQTSISHQFIQEIRDETHRYSITMQKKKMRKTSIQSSLDELAGVGTVRKKLLLRYFGSLEQIKRASIEDLSEVSGIGKIQQNQYINKYIPNKDGKLHNNTKNISNNTSSYFSFTRI